jgi:signal transduction histidine kinase
MSNSSNTGRGPGTGRDRPYRSRRLFGFRNWPVRAKLIAILLVPAIAAVTVGLVRVGDLLSQAAVYGDDADLSAAQRAVSELVADLGREQLAITAAVGNAQGIDAVLPPRDELVAQTDATADEALRLVEATGAPGDVPRRLLGLQDQLARLEDIRADTAAAPEESSLAAAQIVRAYHEVSGAAVALTAALAQSVTDNELRGAALNVQALTETNRLTGLQDGLVLAVVAVGSQALDPAELRTAVDDRTAAFNEFEATATDDQRALFSGAFMSDEGTIRSTEFNEILREVSEGRDPSLTAADWLSVAAPAAAATDGVRAQLSTAQVDRADQLLDETQVRAARDAAIVVALLLAGLVVTVLAARSILSPLRRLRADAILIAEERLPAAITRIREAGPDSDIQVVPVDVRTIEEIGQVARAFDAVHVEAVRLAAEQEQLRRNVNDLFVNLSRRSQALVERQLALIDRLENDEADPDQLAQLFRLDHLAARMRRNNDNLMVLAGSDASRGAGRALRVVDVVRAAVSETEQYERVTVRAAPHVTVAAATSHDLVHLLAELLDNATVFSAPDTTVTVDVQGAAIEGLRIEVADRGLGIPADDLDELNAKLSEPPVVDAGVPRQMGLFVVAHLARRHGIRVSLQPGADGRGTTAVVHVPPAVLVAPESQAAPMASSAPAPASAPASVLPSSLAAPAGGLAVPSPSAEPSLPALGRAVPDDGRFDDTRPQPTVGSSPGAANGARPLDATRAADPARPTEQAPPDSGPGALTGPVERVRSAAPAAAPDPHQDPWEVPSEDETPIFRELSAWFRACTPGTGAIRAPEPVNGASRPMHPAGPGNAAPPRPAKPGDAKPGDAETEDAAAGRPAEREGTVHRIPTTHVVTESAIPSAAFASAADQGWLAAAAAEAGQPAGLTAAGLPRRRPMAQLVPGSAPSAPAAPPRRPRDADAVRGRLANYQRGLQSGRNRIRVSSDGSPLPSDTEPAQSDQRRYAP